MSKRILSVILLICMLVNNLPVAALAEETASDCAHAYAEGVCTVCGETEPQPCAHTGGAATCEALAVCATCGEGYGELAGHTGGAATCEALAVCEVCGESYGQLADHVYSEAGKCACGAECEHAYADGICTVCGMEAPKAEPECGCEVKCAEASETCEVCKADLTQCVGAEPETEAPVITVSDWEWVDQEEIYNIERDVAELAGVGSWEDVQSMLPAAILVDGTEVAVTWECEAFAEASGTYTLKAILPEGYVLEDGTNTLSLTLEMAVDSAEYDAEPHKHLVCIGSACSEEAHEPIEWLPWNSDNSLPDSGNYYLTKDVTLNSTKKISQNLNLCLNGNTITASASGFRGITVTGTFSLTDCSEGKTGEITGFTNTDWKNTEYRGGAISVGDQNENGDNNSPYYAKGTFNMYGGTICGNVSKDTSGNYKFGGGVYLYGTSNVIFNMYGGNIRGNTAGEGGGVYTSANSKFNMYGGTISGNKASANGGGGVMACGNFNMEGGTIDDNTAQGNGGGVCVGDTWNTSNTFNMYGGTISGNQGKNGGGVYSRSRFNMYGGTISGNTATNQGGGAYITSNTCNLSGSPVISGNTNNNCYIESYFTVTGALGEDAEIGVLASSTSSPFCKPKDSSIDLSSYQNRFFSDAIDRAIILEGVDLYAKAITTYTLNFEATKAKVTVRGIETTKAAPGNTVTVTPIVPSGFILKSVTTAPDCEVSQNSNGTYSFTMPTEDVTITVTLSEPVDVTGISLNPQTLALAAGEEKTLTATVLPENATDKTVTWSSSDESVVTVDQDGNVTAKKVGTATITATAGNFSATCAVTVVEKYDLWVGGVQVTSENLTINSEDNADITNGSATYDPENSTLTLTGFKYTGAGYNNAAIYTESVNLNVVLSGVNTITCQKADESITCYAISVEYAKDFHNAGYLTISGTNKATDKLICTANGGIRLMRDLTVANATINTAMICSRAGAVTITDSIVSADVNASGDITVENSELKIFKTANTEDDFNITNSIVTGGGLSAFDDASVLNVTGSTVNVRTISSDAVVIEGNSNVDAQMILVDQALIVTDSSVHVTGSEIPELDLEGIFGILLLSSDGVVAIDNSTVEVYGDNGAYLHTEDFQTFKPFAPSFVDGEEIGSADDYTVTAGETAPGQPADASEAATYENKYVKIAPLPPHVHCVCGDSITHTHNDPSPTWTEWNGTNAVTYDENGTAYVYLSANAERTSALAIPTGKTLNLCLNGKELKNIANNQRVIDVQGGTLNLTDCHSTGTITGGKFAKGDYYKVTGIGVRVINNGTFNMYGGTISGNKNAEGLYHAAGAVSVGNESYGSDVSVGTFNMYGGTISDNASFGGGGVYVNQGWFTMYNGTISGNKAGFRGGGGVFVSDNGTFTMAGGIITDNTCSSGAGVENSGTFIMTGGTITGNTGGYGAGVNNSNQFTLSGNPVINDNYTDSGEASNVYLNETITVNSTLTGADKSIGITMQDGSGRFTTGGAAYADKFVSDNSSYDVVVEGDDLALQEKHSHSYTYSAVGAEITEACTCGHSKKATLSFNDGNGSYTYTGSEIKPVQVTYDADWAGNKSTTITYTNNINVGNANASLTICDATANLVFTIGKANSIGAVSAVENLIYNGEAQALVIAGTVTGGSYEYSLDNTDWSAAIPAATAAGDYIVYWKIVGDGNHNDYVPTQGVAVTVGKKTVTVTADAATKVYGETDPELTYKVEGLVNEDQMTGALTRAAGENADKYAITQGTLSAGDNYTITYTGADLTITKAGAQATAPTANTLTYNGNDQALVTAGTTKDGTVVYSLTENGTYSETIPTGKNAGTYTVWYYVVGDSNHEDSDKAYVKADIFRAPVAFTVKDNLVEAGKTVAPTVTSDPSSVKFTVSYRKDGVEVTPAAVGEYDIYVTIADGNYRHTASTDGSAMKVGVLSIYEKEAPKTYTLSYVNGNTTVTMDAALAGTVRVIIAPDSVPEDEAGNEMLFAGWANGKNVYQPGEKFLQPEENVTLTAKWEAEKYSISGTVKQTSPDTNKDQTVEGATVTLMLGSTTIATTTTNENGEYEFPSCLQGTYNLIAEHNGVRKTIKVVLNHGDQSKKQIVLPAGKTNTVVTVLPGTPAVVVGGMDDEKVFSKADKDAAAAGSEVEIKMEVKENSAPAKKEQIDQKIEASLNDSATVELYIDMDLTKTVREANGNETSTPITETDVLLENIVFLPGHLQGKDAYHVFRHHKNANGTESIEEMAQLTAANGQEGFVVSSDKTSITIYSSKYSTFAIATSELLTVTFDANGGKVTPTKAETNASSKLDSLPVPTREGYTFNDWYTEKTGGTKVTVDTIYKTDTTLYAQWTPVNYKVTVVQTDNGTVYTDAAIATVGTAVKVTVSPKSGYRMSTLTVKDEKGNSYSLGAVNDNAYLFSMPAADVAVTATFVAVNTAVADTTNPKTGDDFRMVLWTGTMLLSSLGILMLLAENKKKQFVK